MIQEALHSVLALREGEGQVWTTDGIFKFGYLD